MFNHFKHKVKIEIAKGKTSWASKASTNSKNMWNIVHDVLGKRNDCIANLVPPDDHGAKAFVNSVNCTFSSVFSSRNDFCFDGQPSSYIDWSPFIDEVFIYKELSHLNINKATGSDSIPPIAIKAAASVLSVPIQHIVNCSLIENYVPILWKRAHVTPVPKTSPPNVDELRPIFLLPAFGKVLEKAV